MAHNEVFKMRKQFFLLLIFLSLFLENVFPVTKVLAKSVSATKTEISLVDGIALDKTGNVYIARRDNNIISRVDLKGNMTAYAGNGSAGFSGDGGNAAEARLNVPAGLALDKKGNLWKFLNVTRNMLQSNYCVYLYYI